eukprot:32266-Prymnesium_polylepis.1
MRSGAGALGTSSRSRRSCSSLVSWYSSTSRCVCFSCHLARAVGDASSAAVATSRKSSMSSALSAAICCAYRAYTAPAGPGTSAGAMPRALARMIAPSSFDALSFAM